MRLPSQRMLLAGAALLALSFSNAQAAQDCAPLRGCAAKFCHIENEIEVAQAHKNVWKETRLRKALSEAKATCTDPALQREREARVKEKQEKVREREAELAEAQTKGKQDKIDKARHKLTEAQDELKEAQAELTR